MKKIILFVILAVVYSFASCYQRTSQGAYFIYTDRGCGGSVGGYYDGGNSTCLAGPCTQYLHPFEKGTLLGLDYSSCQNFGSSFPAYQCGGQSMRPSSCNYTYCDTQCELDSLNGCPADYVWNSSTCTCDPPEPPPCEVFLRCETYFNNGSGLGIAIGPGIAVDSNYSGPGYYAMRLYEVDTCTVGCEMGGCEHLLMDVPGTCSQQGYCPPDELSCDSVHGGGASSSSAGSSSSSYEPPECVCMGCFGGSCLVTCSDGSNRTCVGDFDNCTELKNSPQWTLCTAPNSSGSGGSSGSSGSAPPSNQTDELDALNAIIDTLHHSNELQEAGHDIMKEGQEQNKSFFDDVRGFFGGLLSQVAGIFGNTQSIATNTNNINKGVNNIANKLDSIKNRPRDTTIVNVAGDTINISGDTNIINIPTDSAIGMPWDTTGGLIAELKGVFDSTILGNDTLTEWDTIYRGPVDSIGGAIISTFDSGAGRYYKDSLDTWMNNGLQNGVLSGQGSNSCPAFLMSSYPITIGSITFDLTQNVKLGQYLCQPVIGGRSGWEIGRTILRIIVSIGCMFFLFKCATGTINEE